MSKPSNKLRMVFQCTRSHAAGLELELCGASNTFSMRKSGEEAGNGSTSKTSNAAPVIHPSCKAAINADSYTIGPRAVLINTALGFIQLKVSELIK